MSKRAYSDIEEYYFIPDKYFKFNMADDAPMDPAPAVTASRIIRSDAQYRMRRRLRVPRPLANGYVAIRQCVPLGKWSLDAQNEEGKDPVIKFGDAMTFFNISNTKSYRVNADGGVDALSATPLSLAMFMEAGKLTEKLYQTYGSFRVRSVCVTFKPVRGFDLGVMRTDAAIWWVQNSFDVNLTNPHQDYGSHWSEWMEAKEPRTWIGKKRPYNGFSIKFIPQQDDQGGMNPAGAALWHNVPGAWMPRDDYWKAYAFKAPVLVFNKPANTTGGIVASAGDFTVSYSAVIEFKDPDPVSD